MRQLNFTPLNMTRGWRVVKMANVYEKEGSVSTMSSLQRKRKVGFTLAPGVMTKLQVPALPMKITSK